jgi:translocation and assembly module TamB
LINRILALFLVFVSVSFVFIWEFVQSEFVADILSESITDYTKEKLDLELNFENIEFNLFPPGAEFQNIKIRSLNKDIDLKSDLSSLGVEFDFWDIFKTDFTISNVYLKDGNVLFSKDELSKNPEDKGSKESTIEIEKTIKLIRKKSPVVFKRITLSKIRLEILKKSEVVAHKAVLEINKKSLNLNLEFRNFNLGKIKVLEEVVDKVSVDLNISDSKIKIKTLLVEKNMNRVTASGTVENYKDSNLLSFDLETILDIQIPDIHKYISFKEIGELKTGNLKTTNMIKGTLKDYTVDSEIKLFDLKSSFIKAKTISSTIFLNKNQILIKQFQLKDESQKLELVREIEFYDFKLKKFIEDVVRVKATKLKLNNALTFLGDSLKPIKGELTGVVDFTLNEKDFNFKLSNESYVDNLRLKFDNDVPILSSKKIKLNKGFFDIKGSNVSILLGVEINNTKGDIIGKINNGNISFISDKLKLDLAELGPYAGLKIEGEGLVDIEVVSNNIESKLKIKNSLNNVNFEEFKIEEMKSIFELDFNSSKIKLKQIIAKSSQSTVKGNLTIGLNDKSIKAKLSQSNFLIKDLTTMYRPVIGDLAFLPKNLYGDWRTDVYITGSLSPDKINVRGKFYGNNNLLYDESFDKISFDYSFKNNQLLFENLNAKKTTGKIFGGFSFDMNEDLINIWGNISNIPLSEINNYTKLPLSLNGNLNGVVKASISPEDKQVSSELYISNSSVNNKQIYDSYLKVKMDKQNLSINSSILGEQIKLESKIDFSNSKKNNSFVSTEVNINSLNEIFSIFSFVDNVNTGFDGSFVFKNKSDFNLNKLNEFNSKVSFEELKLNKDKVKVDYQSEKGINQIVVEKGVIKKWDVDIRGSKFNFISKGKGNITKDYNISSKVKIDASLLEIFNVLISKASGTIVGNIENYKKNKVEDYDAKIISNDLELNSDFMPLTLTKGNMLLTYKKKIVMLKKLNAQLNSGQLNMDGTIDFKRVIPDINIRYLFKNAGITLFKKSNILFSGSGSLIGKTIPYTLAGDIQIQQLNIVNEITDFVGGDSLVVEEIDYLPESTTNGLDQFLNLNLNFSTLEPIRITNSMANIGFTGNLQVSGGERDPRLAGKFSLAPMKNEVYFKNNTFSLSKGSIFFYEKNLISNPELDFQAESEINQYKVYLKLLGPVKDFKLDLSAEPNLSKSDVLSLIAFGYTEDLSANLSDAEKESMTKAGVGSIIFDRFKINETLKNEFGLQINLGTEISQDESSYLTHRNSDTSVGKVTSATKIEVKKQISDAIDLSVSSTVGSSTGQKQSMNLNYNIDKNFSIEGVYENRTDSTSETISDDSSLGADVKVRWSFK